MSRITLVNLKGYRPGSFLIIVDSSVNQGRRVGLMIIYDYRVNVNAPSKLQ